MTRFDNVQFPLAQWQGATDYASSSAPSIVYPSAPSAFHALAAVHYSLTAVPTGACALTIQDGSTTVFSIDILQSGKGEVLFNPPRMGSLNATMTVSLAAFGGTGKINCLHWLVDPARAFIGQSYLGQN